MSEHSLFFCLSAFMISLEEQPQGDETPLSCWFLRVRQSEYLQSACTRASQSEHPVPQRHEIMEEKRSQEREITDMNNLVESSSKQLLELVTDNDDGAYYIRGGQKADRREYLAGERVRYIHSSSPSGVVPTPFSPQEGPGMPRAWRTKQPVECRVQSNN